MLSSEPLKKQFIYSLFFSHFVLPWRHPPFNYHYHDHDYHSHHHDPEDIKQVNKLLLIPHDKELGNTEIAFQP